MRCSIRVEFVDDSGRTEVEVFSLERPALITQAELGLAHSEGKRLLFAVQQELVRRQIAAHATAHRLCPHCGSRYALKDYRRRVINTLVGRVRARTPRYVNCPCITPAPTKTISPVSVLLPRRCTPELAVMRAVLGAHMPYREVARLLSIFFPAHAHHNAGTVRNYTLQVGERLKMQAPVPVVPNAAEPIEHLAIALDGTYPAACPVRPASASRSPSGDVNLTEGRAGCSASSATILRRAKN